MAKAEAAKEAVAAVAGKEAAEGAAKMGMAVKVKNKKPLGSLFKHDLFFLSNVLHKEFFTGVCKDDVMHDFIKACFSYKKYAL